MQEFILRVNTVIESLQPSFEIFGGRFSWFAYWRGSCEFAIEEWGHIPPSVSEFYPESGTYDINSLGSLLRAAGAFINIKAASEHLQEYRENIQIKLKSLKKCDGIISPYNEKDVGIYFGDKFPTRFDAQQDAISPYQHRRQARTIIRFDATNSRLLQTILIDRPFIPSWIKSLEAAIGNGPIVEAGTRLRIEGIDNAEVSERLADFLEGKVVLASAGYSMRGFSMPA